MFFLAQRLIVAFVDGVVAIVVIAVAVSAAVINVENIYTIVRYIYSTPIRYVRIGKYLEVHHRSSFRAEFDNKQPKQPRES